MLSQVEALGFGILVNPERDGRFDEEFTDRQLHTANLREDLYLRSATFDARGVSGHARLDAILSAPKPEEAPA